MIELLNSRWSILVFEKMISYLQERWFTDERLVLEILVPLSKTQFGQRLVRCMFEAADDRQKTVMIMFLCEAPELNSYWSISVSDVLRLSNIDQVQLFYQHLFRRISEMIDVCNVSYTICNLFERGKYFI